MTGLVMIQRALRLIGVLRGAGQTAATEDNTEGLIAANAMLAEWSAQQLLVYTATTSAYELTSGRGYYVIAPGQTSPNFDAARPIKILAAGILTANPHDSAKRIRTALDLITAAQHAAIPDQYAESTVASSLYYDQAVSGTLYLWPIPVFSGTPKPALELTVWAALASFANTATDNTFPPGYDEAICAALACRLAPQYGVQCPPEVIALASDAQQVIRRRNAEWFNIPVEGQ